MIMIFSVVIPVYNEIAGVSGCLDEITSRFDRDLPEGCGYEIVISDDGSTDGTGEAVDRWMDSHHPERGKVVCHHETVNSGKGKAVRLGFMDASGDYIMFTDCDLAYGCDTILAMFGRMAESGYDILIGSRAIAKDGYEGYGFLRRTASKAYMKLIKAVSGFSHSDSQCGLKLFRAECGKKIFSMCTVDRWAFDFEVLMIADRMKLAVGEYPVKVLNHGESKIRLVSDSVKMLNDLRKIKKRVAKLDI